MAYTREYAATAPSREQLDAMPGPLVLEFGAAHCGHCLRAQQPIAAALGHHPGVPHIKIEDGPGRPLGRSFRVKLWPTLVFLRSGQEIERVVRPTTVEPIDQALQRLVGADS